MASAVVVTDLLPEAVADAEDVHKPEPAADLELETVPLTSVIWIGIHVN